MTDPGFNIRNDDLTTKTSILQIVLSLGQYNFTSNLSTRATTTRMAMRKRHQHYTIINTLCNTTSTTANTANSSNATNNYSHKMITCSTPKQDVCTKNVIATNVIDIINSSSTTTITVTPTTTTT